MKEITLLLEKLVAFTERIDPLLPKSHEKIDFSEQIACRWVKSNMAGFLQPIKNPVKIRFNDISCQDRQKTIIQNNTLQFIQHFPANNVLLTGAKGTGKSSLVKACINEYAHLGLRIIEIDCDDLVDLPHLLALIEDEPFRFIVYCDDLSFEENDPSYKSLKALLDGSLIAPTDNVLIYATSNRRHLLPEYMHENEQYMQKGNEVHPGEASEEKVSLSERFGLWISFYPFSQEQYLLIVKHWLKQLAIDIEYNDTTRSEALQFSLQRGSRSGRVALQFVKHYIGIYRLSTSPILP